jgi:hypothetical protein
MSSDASQSEYKVWDTRLKRSSVRMVLLVKSQYSDWQQLVQLGNLFSKYLFRMR